MLQYHLVRITKIGDNDVKCGNFSIAEKLTVFLCPMRSGCCCRDMVAWIPLFRSVPCIFLWSDEPLTIGYLDVKCQPISMQKRLRDAYAIGESARSAHTNDHRARTVCILIRPIRTQTQNRAVLGKCFRLL